MSDKPSKTKAEKEERVRKAQQELEDAMWDLLPEGSFAERERAILDLTEKNQKELTKRDLQHIADSFGERVQVGGKTYKRYQSAPVRYHSLGGDLVVVWDSYREEGVRNGPTVVPLELVAGLTQRATPALARNVVHGYARHDMRTHGEILREAHRIPPPRATLERRPRLWQRMRAKKWRRSKHWRLARKVFLSERLGAA